MLSLVLAGAMTVCLAAAGTSVRTYAEETEGGKYVSDVFIAYGKSEDKAAKWLTENGWEPVKGDFNAGKASFFDDNKLQDQNVAAVMGIKRTDDKDAAVTDMAVMNMTGGYSIPDYEKLLKEKKAENNELIKNFMVVIEEYRANLSKKGRSFPHQRAQLSYKMLNQFYDGDPEDPVAVHDTGMKLGDLFAQATVQEGNESGGDLEQLMLESSGPALLAMETFLAFGADPADDTWLERASGLTGDELSENLSKYVPETEGMDVADSEAYMYLNEKYGDTAATLAVQWEDIHEQMLWYEQYCDDHKLWPGKREFGWTYENRLRKYFKNLIAQDAEEGTAQMNQFFNTRTLYNNLYETPYEGDWGSTLGDFFNPADEEYFNPEDAYFLPMAAGLSDGQRASLDFLTLPMLLTIGFGNIQAVESVLPDIEELFGDEKELSIYTGVNREAFRGGVAITSEALMEQNAGKGQAFDRIWDNTGIVAITSYVTAAVGTVTLVAGAVMYFKLTSEYASDPIKVSYLKDATQSAKEMMKSSDPWMQNAGRAQIDSLEKEAYVSRSAGRWLLGIGGAILIAAAIVKGIQMWKYYDRDMKPIPRMIVDESDVVTYLVDDDNNPILDENGNQKKTIDFKTYEYYTAVKCNRPDVGEIGDWNDGVSDYKDEKHYCYDIADLNADMGQEWIALYTVKSRDKGDPILADSLTLQYGKKTVPDHCSQKLHLFTYTNAVDLGDTAWAYNNDKKGVYFFWDTDKAAFAAEVASAFSGGQLALAGIGGLLIGIAGATLMLKKRRRKEA